MYLSSTRVVELASILQTAIILAAQQYTFSCRRAATRDPTAFPATGAQFAGTEWPEVSGTLNKVAVGALPDWGSTVNAVSEDFAKRHGLEIDTNHVEAIPLLGGHVVESIGRVVGQFKFKGEKDTYRLEFNVLRNSLHDVILGRRFLDMTETLTKNSHRIVYGVRSCIRRGKRLFLMDEAPKERIRCAVNGSTAAAFPDTGSDLMLVSGNFVRRHGFRVRRGKKYRTQVQLINGSTIRTDGMVLDAKLQFGIPESSHELDYDRYHGYLSVLSSLTRSAEEREKTTFICDLHVVEKLPCDLILSNDFIFQNNVFSNFRSLFYAEAVTPWKKGAVAMDRCLLFVRNKNVKLSWLSRRNRRTNIEASSGECITSFPPYRGRPCALIQQFSTTPERPGMGRPLGG
ncbi:hypothetical protein NQ176_g375 [Zarea fungicola]|uniref:Uncharacterized protein n=1 Tax=Zarea fungicola TaxID=93591 RepID=A0ACC1NY68_9HYPO|nr:hypothetical protein NQ176_g375 [Lecanicillium fungicola]